MKDRARIMDEYYKNVTKEQLIRDIEKAGMIVKENRHKDDERCEDCGKIWMICGDHNCDECCKCDDV
jgi:hypothetical protein